MRDSNWYLITDLIITPLSSLVVFASLKSYAIFSNLQHNLVFQFYGYQFES